MQIFVRTVSGDREFPFPDRTTPQHHLTPTRVFPLSVPETTPVGNLRSLLALRTNLPESDLRLVHAGRHLTSLSEPLSACGVTRESTLHMALPLRGGAPKKTRCGAKDCKDVAQRIVGDCGFCSGHFCSRHRMLESHNCPGLEDCKQEEKERNKEKLERERTVAIKGT